MDTTFETEAARQSFSGRRLTDSRFNEASHIAGIIQGEIQKSGSFIEKLTDYSHAFARNAKFDAGRAEIMVRDVFTAGYGQSMNKMRETLLRREETVRESASDQALHHAHSIGPKVQQSPTMPYYMALDQAAVSMAHQHSITETGAKKIMSEVFEAAEGRPLREVGKELEERHHKPVRDAEIAARKAQRDMKPNRVYARSGPQR